MESAAAAGFASLLCDGLFYPFDTMKIQQMVNRKDLKILPVWRNSFIGYRFFLLQSIPSGAIYMSLYEPLKVNAKGEFSIMHSIAAGALAEIAIYFVRMPFEIIKTQIQIGKIESNAHSILKYVRSRKLLQLYEGFRLTFLRDLVFAGSELPLWDLMKDLLQDISQLRLI